MPVMLPLIETVRHNIDTKIQSVACSKGIHRKFKLLHTTTGCSLDGWHSGFIIWSLWTMSLIYHNMDLHWPPKHICPFLKQAVNYGVYSRDHLYRSPICMEHMESLACMMGHTWSFVLHTIDDSTWQYTIKCIESMWDRMFAFSSTYINILYVHKCMQRTADSTILWLFRPHWGSSVQCTHIHIYILFN